jgi:hypothetical protein
MSEVPLYTTFPCRCTTTARPQHEILHVMFCSPLHELALCLYEELPTLLPRRYSS